MPELKKHAYLVIAHEDLHQLRQLLSLLDDERNDVYLQADSKSGLSVDEIVLRRSSLTVLPPFPIYWGGLSLIQAELNLLRAASVGRYHYYHLLSGSDLPLVSQDRVHAFLEHSDLEYVDFAPENQSIAHWKAAYYHVLVENKLYRRCWTFRMLGHFLVELQAAVGVDRSRETQECYYHGSAFFSITHSCLEYVLTQEPWVKTTFHHTLSCEEVFMQTLLIKSPFRSKIAGGDSASTGNLRYIDWGRRNKNSPYTFKMSDYEELKAAGADCLFARKFSRTVDPLIVDTIVNRIKEKGAL
jgi:hypothetical protein